MTRPGGPHHDPAALERAARELQEIARQARRQAGAMERHISQVKPVANGVNSIIGGTATGTDKQMTSALARTLKDLAAAARALSEAAGVAERLAQEATARALSAREAQAARHSNARR